MYQEYQCTLSYHKAKRLETRDARIIAIGNRPHLPVLIAVFRPVLTIFSTTTFISFTKSWGLLQAL